jgi:hypothetical protein
MVTTIQILLVQQINTNKKKLLYSEMWETAREPWNFNGGGGGQILSFNFRWRQVTKMSQNSAVSYTSPNQSVKTDPLAYPTDQSLKRH